MNILNLSVDRAKSNFFDRKTVTDVLDEFALKKFSRFGAFTRRTARQSMRKAPQKTMAQLTDDERLIFEIRKQEWKEEGGPKPRRPLRHSEPWDPPFWIAGDIKRLLFFAYDPEERSVVVGPAILNGGEGGVVPRTLEEGGFVETPNGRFHIAPRPYMEPAFEENLHVLSMAI